MIVIVLFVYLYSLRKLPDVQNPIFFKHFLCSIISNIQVKVAFEETSPKAFYVTNFWVYSQFIERLFEEARP